MLRFLTSPRALALHIGTVVCVVLFVLLAGWQWDRAQFTVVDPTTLTRVSISEVSEPGPQVDAMALGRAVTATGTYVAKDRFFIADRSQAGQSGFWVMVPLELSDSTRIPVVRGFVETMEEDAARVPVGKVVVKGTLQGSEDLSQVPLVADGTSNDDVLSGIATSELVGLVQGPLHPGWIAATAESPVPQADIVRLDPEVLAVTESGLRLQNVAYTIQWTVFALFVVFVYRKFLLDARVAYDKERGRRSDAPTIKESA